MAFGHTSIAWVSAFGRYRTVRYWRICDIRKLAAISGSQKLERRDGQNIGDLLDDL